ncbi:MAG: hypothetical protein JO218_13015 [Burkholderiales bacterium]|nr:hypothetical protein [Burkholderiales bacterium]
MKASQAAGLIATGLFALSTTTVTAEVMQAAHQKTHLKGTYSYTGQGACLYSPAGFDPVALTTLGNSTNSNFSVTGTWVWDGAGNSALSATIVSISYAPSAVGTGFVPSASSVSVKATFKSSGYGADGGFTETMQSFVGTFLTGARKGQTFTVSNTQEQAYISQDGKALTMAGISPDIQTQTIYNAAGSVVATQQRICNGSRTMVRLS